MDRYGEMFIYTYRKDIKGITRSMLLPFKDAQFTPPNLPFRHQSRGDFSGTLEDWLKLDTGLYLDAEDALWNLDTSASEISTNHIGLEYFIDRIIIRRDADSVTGIEKETEYLMTKEYLDYINRSIEFARRAKEVPHIGSQLSIQTDITGLCNSYEPETDYTIPSLKLKAVTRPDYFDLVSSPHDISYIEFGIGKQNVASVQNPDVPFPSALASKVCTVSILFQDQIGNERYVGAVGEYLGQSLRDFKVLAGSSFDGVKQNFEFNLPFAPVQRGNITFEFHLPTGKVLSFSDDRKGMLLSLNGYGTIDYKTGNCHISTKFNYPQVDNMESIISSLIDRTHFTHILLGGDSVVPGSLGLTFTSGEDADQRTFMVNDDGEGNFVHPLIQSGVVDYNTKQIDITFNAPLVDSSVKPFTCRYSFPVDFKLPEGTELLASYFFTQQPILITEAGFRSKDGDLLNYATFPPCEFNSTEYHLNFMLLIQKPALDN
jgi:hypothetical protein